MKKILFLGGARKSLDLIKYANEKGYETYLCDNTDNPGQYIVRHNYKTSAGDVNEICRIVEENSIDGVISYSSDKLAVVQAKVAEKCGLPGNTVESTMILTQKDLFRHFLREHHFNEPFICCCNKNEFDVKKFELCQFPIMVKPVDSAGSSGVTKVLKIQDLKQAFDFALSFSKSGKVIFEKFIENKYEFVIAGDVFVSNGEVVFYGLMDEMRENSINPFLPLGTMSHLFITDDEKNIVKNEIKRLVKEVGFNFGGMNVEMIIDKNNDVYFLELAPRNGGNRIPDQINYSFGINMKEMLVESSLGKTYAPLVKTSNKLTDVYILHTYENGALKQIYFDDSIENKIVRKWDIKPVGSCVESFSNATKSLGYVLIEFETINQLKNFLDHHNDLVHVNVVKE